MFHLRRRNGDEVPLRSVKEGARLQRENEKDLREGIGKKEKDPREETTEGDLRGEMTEAGLPEETGLLVGTDLDLPLLDAIGGTEATDPLIQKRYLCNKYVVVTFLSNQRTNVYSREFTSSKKLDKELWDSCL